MRERDSIVPSSQLLTFSRIERIQLTLLSAHFRSPSSSFVYSPSNGSLIATSNCPTRTSPKSNPSSPAVFESVPPSIFGVSISTTSDESTQLILRTSKRRSRRGVSLPVPSNSLWLTLVKIEEQERFGSSSSTSCEKVPCVSRFPFSYFLQRDLMFSFVKQTRGTWEEQQKMDALRKAFQRAVQVPLNNVEQIWQDYNAFENGLSKMTVRSSPRDSLRVLQTDLILRSRWDRPRSLSLSFHHLT